MISESTKPKGSAKSIFGTWDEGESMAQPGGLFANLSFPSNMSGGKTFQTPPPFGGLLGSKKDAAVAPEPVAIKATIAKLGG